MLLIQSLSTALQSTDRRDWQLRQITATGLFLLLMVLSTFAGAADESELQQVPSTQTIREQLKQLTRDRNAAAQEQKLQANAVARTRKSLQRLNVAVATVDELVNTVRQLEVHDEAKKLAEASEAQATKAIAALTIQLERHVVADELQLAADVAMSRLEEPRRQIDQVKNELAALHKESFVADQAARREDRQADTVFKQAEETRLKLPDARDAASLAETEMETARTQSIEAARELAVQNRLLNQAKSGATRAHRSAERLANTSTAIETSIVSLRQVEDVSEDQLTLLVNVMQQISPLQERAQQLVEENLAVVAERQTQYDSAVDELEQAESERRMKAGLYSQLSRRHFALQREVARLMVVSQEYRNAASEFMEQKEQLGSVIAQKDKRIAELVVVIDRLQNRWTDARNQAEQAQEPLGRFVSFSRHIAPILARRCTACHNTRSTEGGLNLSSFANLLKGGDSGSSLTPHDADDSLLLSMVQDGSMPKDADPLTPDEIDWIRRWIDVGAPLDATASANADLFDIMPELPQPGPPDTYRVPVPVLATAFSPDGSLLATSGYHEVLLWGTDGELIRRITNVAQRVNDLTFTADGEILVVAAGTPGQLGELKLFRVSDGTHLGTPVRTTDSVYTVSISPDGSRLAAGGADRKITIVDIETQKILYTIEDHADSVMDVAWSPQSDRVASASYDNSCRVFDAASGQVRKTFTNHGQPVYTVSFLSDGESLVSGGADKKLRVWPVGDGKQIREITGFDDPVFRIAVTTDGRVYSAGADSQIREHQLSDGELVRTMTGHTDWVYALTLDTQGNRLATGCYDGEVRLWNPSDGTMVSSFVAVPQQDLTDVTVSER
ncbi:MAG: hypothetical protein MK102_06700 [Fuerstiella sp.]|nr:hypothetical protein [Fuerstiella sp.]